MKPYQKKLKVLYTTWVQVQEFFPHGLLPMRSIVYAVEINKSIGRRTGSNLKCIKNVEVICADAREVSFSKKADVIICEMLGHCTNR